MPGCGTGIGEEEGGCCSAASGDGMKASLSWSMSSLMTTNDSIMLAAMTSSGPCLSSSTFSFSFSSFCPSRFFSSDDSTSFESVAIVQQSVFTFSTSSFNVPFEIVICKMKIEQKALRWKCFLFSRHLIK